MVEYDNYEIVGKLRTPIAGGIPMTEDVIDSWLEARAPPTKPKDLKGGKELDELKEQVKDEVQATEDREKRAWTTFKKDDDGPYIEARQLRAMLREAAYVLEITKGKGSVARKQLLQHGTVIEPLKVHFSRNGTPITDVEEQVESAIKVMGPKGPRTALKRMDLIRPGAEFKFTVSFVRPLGEGKARISKNQFEEMVRAAQHTGLGASRTQDYGLWTWQNDPEQG